MTTTPVTQKSKTDIARLILSAFAGVPLGLLYGVIARWAFGPGASDLLSTMTCGFLFVVPFAMGALTVFVAPPVFRRSRAFAFFMPWLSCLLVIAVVVLLDWEVYLCVLMATPIMLPIAGIGGLVFRNVAANRSKSATTPTMMLGLLLLTPYLIAPVETRLPETHSLRVVQNEIIVNASVDTVWSNIISVPLIQPEEQGFSLFHLFGLPKPLEATLSHEGVGGVRNATFEGNLSFVETVTEWTDHQSLSFSIVTSNTGAVPAPLDQIGGKYFDVLEGTYVIEPLGDGQVRLFLSSKHRLTTRFNFYGGLWTDSIMSDLQSYILRIIKARAEAGG